MQDASVDNKQANELSSIESHYDAVVVGGSMVGATLVNLLARQAPGLRIALIEPMSIAAEPLVDSLEDIKSFEPRVSAISLASENLFKFCDAWDSMVDYRVSPYTAMEVWDDEGSGRVRFDSHEGQLQSQSNNSEKSGEIGMHGSTKHLGHIIENKAIIVSLWQQLTQLQSLAKEEPKKFGMVSLFEGSKLTAFKREQSGWSLSVDQKPTGQCSTISCDLLIAADGANSIIAQQEELAKRSWDYKQSGVVCTIKTEKPHQACARQNFLSTGPLALLPLSLGKKEGTIDTKQQYCSIVWSCTHEKAQSLMQMDDQSFRRALTVASDFCLGEVLEATPRLSFPLKQSHATRYIKEDLALVGDAAHTIHPLAGQGANLGLLDAAVLAEELSNAAKAGVAVNTPAVLRRYERRRKGHNLSMMATMEGFKQSFANQAAPIKAVRSLGMNVFNALPAIKNKVLARAMGSEGDLPLAARSS